MGGQDTEELILGPGWDTCNPQAQLELGACGSVRLPGLAGWSVQLPPPETSAGTAQCQLFSTADCLDGAHPGNPVDGAPPAWGPGSSEGYAAALPGYEGATLFIKCSGEAFDMLQLTLNPNSTAAATLEFQLIDALVCHLASGYVELDVLALPSEVPLLEFSARRTDCDGGTRRWQRCMGRCTLRPPERRSCGARRRRGWAARGSATPA